MFWRVGLELNSAPLNCTGGITNSSYKHGTPNGVTRFKNLSCQPINALRFSGGALNANVQP